ncbi:hypothetical protein [Phormidium nigroviride]
MRLLLLVFIFTLSFIQRSYATTPAPATYTWCVLKMIQTDTHEMIQAAYGMGNTPVVNNELCEDFYSRDVRVEGRPVTLVGVTPSINTSNPDAFWTSNTWRRPMTEQEIEDYACYLINSDFFSSVTVQGLKLMPSSPNNIRIPALLLTALESTNSPIISYVALTSWNTMLPILSIAALTKLWKIIRK